MDRGDIDSHVSAYAAAREQKHQYDQNEYEDCHRCSLTVRGRTGGGLRHRSLPVATAKLPSAP